jgi:hypothetical protein
MAAETETAAERQALEGARPRRRARGAEEAAFRASVEERLRGLEAEIGEVKLRLNGLLFFIASTVLGQVLLKVVS